MIRQCRVCHKYFSVSDPLDPRMVCSEECQDLWKEGRAAQNKSEVGVCKYCGQEFRKNTSSRKYCSEECKRKASYEKRKRNKANVELDAEGNPIRRCKQCGKPIVGLSNIYKRLYCSEECKVASTKERKRRNNKRYYTNTYAEDVVEAQTTSKSKLDASIVKPRNKVAPKKPQAGASVASHRKEALLASEEMEAWYASKRARKNWVKVPLEEADAICKQYGLSYPQYQYMKYEGTLTQYLATHEPKDT